MHGNFDLPGPSRVWEIIGQKIIRFRQSFSIPGGGGVRNVFPWSGVMIIEKGHCAGMETHFGNVLTKLTNGYFKIVLFIFLG